MAVQKYVERGRILLAGLLREGNEVYKVGSVHVYHKIPGDDPRDWVCVRCRKLIEDHDTYRRIVSRRAGTMWTDRTYWPVHNVPCFMGRNLKG